jgi:hypothetical protein
MRTSLCEASRKAYRFWRKTKQRRLMWLRDTLIFWEGRYFLAHTWFDEEEKVGVVFHASRHGYLLRTVWQPPTQVRSSDRCETRTFLLIASVTERQSGAAYTLYPLAFPTP